MEKYTDLEQALQDSSLVIITDKISSLTELNRAFVKYKVLLKKQKRFSNYYSNEFLGHSVPEMYVLVREKLNSGSSLEDQQMSGEAYVLSEPDLYYKEESFNSGDTNICFILGHSGSGKSQMARTLEGDHIDHIELDDLLLAKDHFTLDELKSIDTCFINGDTDGINEILQRAEANVELSTWNKMKIYNECKAALLELSL